MEELSEDLRLTINVRRQIAEWLLNQTGGWNGKCLLELLDDPEERDRVVALLRLIEPCKRSKVRIVKIAATPNAGARPGDWSDFRPGQLNHDSLPIAYEMEGVFISPPIPGEIMRVARTNRNGVEIKGEFISSPVTEVIAVTRNSVYRVTVARNSKSP